MRDWLDEMPLSRWYAKRLSVRHGKQFEVSRRKYRLPLPILLKEDGAIWHVLNQPLPLT